MIDVRPETPDDIPGIEALLRTSFAQPDEAELVAALRANRAWLPALSIVAVDHEDVVGHALFTRIHVADTPVLALAPVAVLPHRQREGIGTAVVRGALDAAKATGEQLVIVLGDPAYYGRFGFRPARELGIHGPFGALDEFQALALGVDDSAIPVGFVRYSAPFAIPVQVRTHRLAPDDWRLLRDVRLRALTDSPDSFGASKEAEAAWTPEQWQLLLGTEAWVVAESDGEVIGLVNVRPAADAEDADCWIRSWWVAPAQRGGEVSAALLVAADDACRAEGWARQGLGVWCDNDRARALFARLGFVQSGGEHASQLWGSRCYVRMLREVPEMR